ncbi:MAG: WYL domain-containing protein [Acidimicrobiaceae bacterium]|nr:WYL domain-containing protein [Acidimicrobiaceae bacterium]
MTSATAADGARLSVTERMARLLGVVPWVVEQGGAHLDDIAARFDYPREQLLEDLTQRLFFVGVHPFTPDTLIDVNISDGIVDIQYADWFSQPMRLTGEEATRLLAAGRTVLDMSTGRESPTGDDEAAAAPLVRALTKLSLSLGSGETSAVDHIDVCLGQAPAETLDGLRRAVNQGRQIEIEYYSQGRDAMTSRAVDPARLLSHDGVWYLFGWCHRAGAERVFRVDRIRALTVTDSAAEVDLTHGGSPALKVDTVGRAATIRLAPQAAWAADYYPVRQRTDHADGTVDAVFAVASESWLARLLVQLGPQGEMIDSHTDIDPDLRAATAARMLERYRR